MQIPPLVIRFGLSVALLGAAAHAQTMTWTVHAGDCRFVPSEGGLRIEMEGFGHLQEPGAPLVPSRNVLLALPPGARATAVEVTALASEMLPGSYRLAPASPLLPVPDPKADRERLQRLQEEWRGNFAAIYASDRPFPATPGEFVGTGSMREYAYASVAVRPFTYYPRSGRLVHHRALRITVHYEVPAPGSEAARHLRTLRPVPWNDARAATSFVNIDDVLSSSTPAAGGLILPEPRGWDYLAITRDWPVVPGGAESFCLEFNGHHIDYGKTLGEALYDMKWDCHQSCPFANWYEFLNQWDYSLYGDPAMTR